MLFKKKRNKIIRMGSERASSKWKNKNLKNEKESGFWSRLFFQIIALAFLSVVIYVLFFSRFLLVNVIIVEGAVNTGDRAIEEIAQKEIKGKLLKYLNKNNFIILNAGKIEERIKENYKIIEEVKIKREFPDKLRITVSEKNPTFIISNSERCFIISEKGLIFDEAGCDGKYLNLVELPVFNNEKNKKTEIGEFYLEADYINFISVMRRAIEDDLEIKLEKEMRTPSIISSDIRFKTKEGWEIYLNERLGCKKELEMFQTILESKIDEEKRKELEYIDLRTENKVYYKFKNSEENNQEENAKDLEKTEESEDTKKKKD